MPFRPPRYPLLSSELAGEEGKHCRRKPGRRNDLGSGASPALLRALSGGISGRRQRLECAGAGGGFRQTPRQIARKGNPCSDLRGEVVVNGRPADERTLIRAGDMIETGRDSHLIAAVGDTAFILREDSSLEVERHRAGDPRPKSDRRAAEGDRAAQTERTRSRCIRYGYHRHHGHRLLLLESDAERPISAPAMDNRNQRERGSGQPRAHYRETSRCRRATFWPNRNAAGALSRRHSSIIPMRS